MSKSLIQLKREAIESTTFRGHDMGEWNDVYKGTSVCHCKVCNMQVAVTTNPAPNDIDIGGEAVALGCIDQGSILYTVTAKGYVISVLDSDGSVTESYTAYNHPHDSGQQLLIDDPIALTIDQLRVMAKATAEDMAIEYDILLKNIHEESIDIIVTGGNDNE
ncbi:MAG TPA: hypothetical protein VMV86_00305 [Methanosarcinales archaeon]|nr:hypothetical protein [Methanosarcinales archaeon]